MRGLGAFQLAQMKQRDARVSVLFQHVRLAIDVLEQIVSNPYRPPERSAPEPVTTAPALPVGLPPEKLAYTIKEACASLGIGRTMLYQAIADGVCPAVKLGGRTLIPAAALRQWIASLPSSRGT